ncbi:MAG: type II toxin-antitoxin system mRNA interferase toxin, RelE/StbE family [Acidimicrobiales bacterium]|nr:MAG: type II toxin-antitoxin system mRNA interferase toxin, RelE/StbE family [Acidimicrobiales bacterium]
MAWKVELDEVVQRGLRKLDPQIARRILAYLYERIAPLANPRELGEALQGSQFGHLWRYRTGDWRIVAEIRDHVLCILVVRVDHRNKVYRNRP